VRYQIIDFLNIQLLELEANTMLKMYGTHQSKNNSKLAFVANKVDIIKLFNAYIDNSNELKNPWSMQIFHSKEAARDWLNAQQLA